jgi:hypothetical protein
MSDQLTATQRDELGDRAFQVVVKMMESCIGQYVEIPNNTLAIRAQAAVDLANAYKALCEGTKQR